jgi:restriction endonuclease
MTNIRAAEMLVLDDLFEMGGGYVLNFSDSTFSQFFANELQIGIDDPIYAQRGGSKGKRLRCFLQTCDRAVAARALQALSDYRTALRRRSALPDGIDNAHAQLLSIVQRLEGPTRNAATAKPNPLLDQATIAAFRVDLLSLSDLGPQRRGFAFEKLLKRLFDAYGLETREALRIRGEQIDGSFQLSNETYLLEAKWQGPPCGAAELHVFQGKIEQKAAWTRGLFVSNSGFTDEGLAAFGRGKRVVCMDGLDLHDVLTRELLLGQVLEVKVRRAAESGLAFARVRDLFPR